MKWAPTTVMVIVLAIMTWLAAGSDDWRHAFVFTGQKSDYYNLLVDGFLDGHLYMKAKVDPNWLSPDPEVHRHAAYLLDASLYQGRYYLYFGVVPAVLLFLPYSAITGHDLPENAAILLMIAVGFLLYVRTYAEARRRYFPSMPRWLDALCIVLLAAGPVTPVLLVSAGMYEVAIAGGYVCMAAAWWFLFRALHSERRAGLWLALASLAIGLAVGCRPIYLFALPALVIVALLRACRSPPLGCPGGRRKIMIRLAGAAIIPAGIIGLLLMAYNYGRFRNPFEFGFNYQVSPLLSTGLPFVRAAFLWPNLKWYYLTAPVVSLYFPYIFPINAANRPPDYYGYEPIHGQWLILLLLLLCLVGLMRMYFLRQRVARELGVFLALSGGMFVLLFLSMATFGFRANRYIVDFQSTLILSLVLSGGYVGSQAVSAGSLARLWRAGFGLLAGAAVIFNVLVGLQLLNKFEYTRPGAFQALSYCGNYPSHLFAKWGLVRYGPFRLKVTFTPKKKAVIEPLLVTGTTDYADILYAAQYPGGLVELSIIHDRHGGPKTDLLKVEYGRAYEIEVDMGSFYPPKYHAYFHGWADVSIDKLKTTARVLFDGTEVLRTQMRFYDAAPFDIFFGKNPAGIDVPFSGRITAIQRLPPRDLSALGLFTETGIWRLQVVFPFHVQGLGQPILASGVTGAGNLLLLEVVDRSHLWFGFDQWGASYSQSPPLEIKNPGPHQLEIFAGPQIVRQQWPGEWQIDAAALQASSSLLRVWLDGRLVWTTPIALHTGSYEFVSIGSNPQGFSTAAANFSGTLKRTLISREEIKEFLLRNLRESKSTQP